MGGRCKVTELVSCFGQTTHKAVHCTGQTEKGPSSGKLAWGGASNGDTGRDKAASVDGARMWLGSKLCGCRENPDHTHACMHTSRKGQAGHAGSTSGSENTVRHEQMLAPPQYTTAPP